VLIGGVAATLHGSPLRTGDTDICPESTPDNLGKLAGALRELNARIRTEGVEGGLVFSCDAAFLSRVALLNLETDAGDSLPVRARSEHPVANVALSVDAWS
jgi:hypothetical protein